MSTITKTTLAAPDPARQEALARVARTMRVVYQDARFTTRAVALGQAALTRAALGAPVGVARRAGARVSGVLRRA